jgi:hypothetical protein
MAKKCIPGVFCIENMTLFLLFVILVVILYMFHQQNYKQTSIPETKVVVVATGDQGLGVNGGTLGGIGTPPSNDMFIRSSGSLSPGIETRGPSPSFSQIGILTPEPSVSHNTGTMILPLMGRKLSGREKMQYYTTSNNGNMNVKLPVSKNGKSCTGEYGCDEIYNGDTVYVEGYAEVFKATIYENTRLSYIPYV